MNKRIIWILIAALFFVRLASAESDRALVISAALDPAVIAVPQDVNITFTMVNASTADAQNVSISTADGLQTEVLGLIAASDSRVLSRAHTVTQQEFEQGVITYIVSHDGASPDSAKVNYTVQTPIQKATIAPGAELTRRISSLQVSAGGTLALVYGVRNTGNVALSGVRVNDAPGDFTARAETLGVGETKYFLNRLSVNADVVSAPVLTYTVPSEGEKEYTRSLTETAIALIDPQLLLSLSLDAQEYNVGDTLYATLSIFNMGGAVYSDMRITDLRLGGVLADSLSIKPSSDPLVMTFEYPVRRSGELCYRVDATSSTGERVSHESAAVAFTANDVQAVPSLELSVTTATPKINRAGKVAFTAHLTASDADISNVRLHSAGAGDIRRLAVVPSAQPVTLEFTQRVTETADITFIAEYADAAGALQTSTSTVSVGVGAGGVPPIDDVSDELTDMSGGAPVKFNDNSFFLVLTACGGGVLAVLFIALIVTSRKRRRVMKQKKELARRRRVEDLSKTARFKPVKRKK